MKIGIITFHDADNFGAQLQSYGLQTALESLGAECCFLDFPGKKTTVDTPSSPLMQRILQHQANRQKLFADFRDAYLKRVAFDENLVHGCDLFLAGSDQVWNPAITGGEGKYLLTFAPANKRCSYAASFGRNALPGNCQDSFSRELRQFRKISVREKSGVELVSCMTGTKPRVDIDPSMLLHAAQWEKMLAPSKTEKSYLLLITVQNDMHLLRMATQMAKDRNLDLKVISASFFPPVGFQSWSDVSVCDWLRLVHDADVVISSSFHGLVFSILFHREFYVNPLVSELADRNSRITELLEMLDISDRSAGATAEALDWVKIDTRIAVLRAESIGYLKSLVEDVM